MLTWCLYLIFNIFPCLISQKLLEIRISNYKEFNLLTNINRLGRRIKSKLNRTFKLNTNLKNLRNSETLWYEGLPSNSLSLQDLFVLNYCDRKIQGFYLEIGAGWYRKINNTYVLEKYYDWKGLSVDNNLDLVSEFNLNRINLCIAGDALKLNYESILKDNNFPEVIDYLSLDIDPAHQTLKVLLSLPWNIYKFKVITFEHDSYQNGNQIKYLSRMFLQKLGYKLVKKDVAAPTFGKYEDWWAYHC